MSALFRMLLAASGGVPAAVALADWALVGAMVSDSDNDADLTTGTLTVAAGMKLAGITVSRDGDSTGHGTLTASGFTLSPGFTIAETFEGQSGDPLRYVRASLWTATVASGTSGTVEWLPSGALFQKAAMIFAAPGLTAIDQTGGAAANSGASINLPHDATPDAGAASLACLCSLTAATSWTCSSGYSQYADASGSAGGALQWQTFRKLGSPANPVVYGGLGSTLAHAGVVITGT